MLVGKVFSKLPNILADNVKGPIRLNSYGEIIGQPIGSGYHGMAIEGTYFKAVDNPGTTRIANAQYSYLNTKPYVIIRNTSTSSTGPTMYLDTVRLTCTDASGGGMVQIIVVTDQANRYSSGGATLTNYNASQGGSYSSVGQVYVGALTATSAGGSAVETFRTNLKQGNINVSESIIIKFDEAYPVQFFGMTAPCGPVILPPNLDASCLIYVHNIGGSIAPTFHSDISWWEV